MECPKCHKNISDNTTVCPYCHKVLALTCPNCHSINHTSVCKKCGYIILEKCSKCGKMVPTTSKACKCGYPVTSSIALNECEIDEFASVVINFPALKDFRRLFGSQELYTKFLIKLKNIISNQLNGCNAQIIIYGDKYTANFNRELSFQTSANKAARLALKIITAFTSLNLNMINEFGVPLKITVTLIRKKAEELLLNKSIDSKVKLMILKNEGKTFLKGMQVIVDQYCQDTLKDYKTDSLYSLEIGGQSVMFYEILLDNYILPPNKNDEGPAELIKNNLKNKIKDKDNFEQPTDIYGFSIFDLNAKCSFQKHTAQELKNELTVNKKIIVLRGPRELGIKTSELVNIYKGLELKPIYVACTEDMNYKPWGFFEKLFKEYYSLPSASGLIDPNFDAKRFNTIKKLIRGDAQKFSSSEDARFSYMEFFADFLSRLKKYVIIVDGLENIDDTSIQALELYFDIFVNVYNNFVFITNSDIAAHSKIKGLLQTFLYTEISMVPNSLDGILSGITEDASDFIQSFYYEKIKENYNGSALYFDHAIRYLTDKGVLANFDNKLIIKNYGSFILPKDLSSLIRTRLKALGKYQDASMILAFSVFLGERLDFTTLEQLGIKNIKENVEILNNAGFTYSSNNILYINNYVLMKPILTASLKQEVLEFIAKTILAKLGKVLDSATLILLMDKLGMHKEEYMLLWKNSQLAIDTGDYDAYLKNCLKSLSILDKISDDLSEESIDNQKKDIYQKLLNGLYAYSPAKIYSLSYILLMDAIESGDNDKVVRLSNLMLQGALITSNYTHAVSLLHNILNGLPSTSLIINGEVNTKYLLLSLINIEILFNIGDYKTAIELANNIMTVLKPNIIEKIKPVNFSTSSFINHMMDTFRIVGFAMLITNDDKLEQFFKSIESSLNEELPDKNCILAIKEFLNGKNFTPSNIELTTPFSKVIFLILQELSNLKTNYKLFAQNIYQAKLLASEMHQNQLEYLCEILIAYAYAKSGITVKSDAILNDIIKKAEDSSIFNILILAKYVLILTKIANSGEETLIMINDILTVLQENENQAEIFYIMFEKLFIDIIHKQNVQSIDIVSEIQKLLLLSPDGALDRIIKSTELNQILEEQNTEEITENSQEAAGLIETTEVPKPENNISNTETHSTEIHT